MPVPDFLVVDIRDGGAANVQVYLLRAGLLKEAIGNTIGAKGGFSSGARSHPENAAVRYKGRLYAGSPPGIHVYNPVTDVWDVSRSFPFVAAARSGSPGPMLVVNTTSGDFLVTYSSEEGLMWRYDGTTWVSATGGSGGSGRNNGLAFVHNGLYHFYVQDLDELKSYDVAANTTVINYGDPGFLGVSGNAASVAFFSLDDRLFCQESARTSGSTPISGLFEFTGSWNLIGPATDFGCDAQAGRIASMRVGDDVFVFGSGGAFGASAGLKCGRWQVLTPGAAPTFTDFTTPVVPPGLRSPGSGDPDQYVCHAFVDASTVPGTPRYFLMFFDDSASSVVPTLYEFTNESTVLASIGNPDITGAFSRVVAHHGGGNYLNGIRTVSSPLVTTTPAGSEKGNTGVIVKFTAHESPLIVPHGSVTGTLSIGETATQTPSGATGVIVEVGTGQIKMGSVTGTWTDTQGFTTAGGSATQNAVTTEGLADKTVTARFFKSGTTVKGVPVTLVSMVAGSGTGGGTVSGNQFINVTADELTEYSFQWDFLGDTVDPIEIASFKLFITRP